MNQQSSLWSDAWRRLLANKAAVAGGLVLLILIVLAIFAPWIAPHSYSYQNPVSYTHLTLPTKA